jgi:hypothetical protein
VVSSNFFLVMSHSGANYKIDIVALYWSNNFVNSSGYQNNRHLEKTIISGFIFGYNVFHSF